MDTVALMVRSIRLSYQDNVIVDDFSLGLKPQELGCLLGPSGCGKSTLLRAIAGFQALDSGEIWLDNELLSTEHHRVSPEHRGVGMVFQDIALFPHLTVAENITFGLKDWPKTSQAKRLDELLELIGLVGLNQRYPHELSGGQQQRVALALSLIHISEPTRPY